MQASTRRTAATLILAGVLIAAWFAHGSAGRVAVADTVPLSAQQRAAGLRFAPEVSASDRAWILAAIASARPEARHLIAEVDGTIEFRTHRGEPLGLARSGPDGSVITIDVASLDGRRQVDRGQTVLHELGHVVDYVLVSRRLDDRLDAGIPRTGVCEEIAGVATGACTERAERFADTFAKWALRGAISAVGAGYGVPTPPSLEDWGAPLVALSNQPHAS
jgi:hypothetical protein